ncbi:MULTISPECIES: catalase [Ramlibacter]|uniref:Catalase n=1 Tax=Ramlibacter aquaticus TaxID=2780094 RepID=A0ABR9SIT8_9BURK|nr:MULTISPECIES: catalase [Ramlibacter]MBE7941932.1 catalase [Ramlibacter aquaticus]
MVRRSLAPSTAWQERVAPDEAVRHARYADIIEELQARKSLKWGDGRALHRKQVVAAQGTLQVLDGTPGYAQHGVFAEPRDLEVWLRLSNGSFDRGPDAKPDIRGFALRVFGVAGPSNFGQPTEVQNFTFINQERFAFRASDEFLGFVEAAGRGGRSLARHLVSRYGLIGGPLQLARMAASTARRFQGFASETFHSVLPMACGPYAVRLRLLPAAANGPAARGKADWSADFCDRLRARPLHWDLQMQYYADERSTPIEDPTVAWATPWSTVAHLMLPRQDLGSPAGQALARQVEAGAFDPWQGLAEHRPLGEVQRARRATYLPSQQGRGAA